MAWAARRTQIFSRPRNAALQLAQISVPDGPVEAHIEVLGLFTQMDKSGVGKFLDVMGNRGRGDLKTTTNIGARRFALSCNHAQRGEAAGIGDGFGDLLELTIVHKFIVTGRTGLGAVKILWHRILLHPGQEYQS
jgi:hypothetical protein